MLGRNYLKHRDSLVLSVGEKYSQTSARNRLKYRQGGSQGATNISLKSCVFARLRLRSLSPRVLGRNNLKHQHGLALSIGRGRSQGATSGDPKSCVFVRLLLRSLMP